MLVTNYFKANGHFFFFNDGVLESVVDAWSIAKLTSSRVAVDHPVPEAGPWDEADVVGHRPRTQILRGIKMSSDGETLLQLRDELDQLDARFFDVGRAAPRVSA